MAKVTVKIDEAYRVREKKERLKQIKQKQEEKRQQRQALLAALADKRAKGRLTLEDIFEQQQVIIEMLNDLQERDEPY